MIIKALYGLRTSGARWHKKDPNGTLVQSDKTHVDMSPIGCMKWAVSLCRCDIVCAIMTMGRFRNAPREGHEESVKRIKHDVHDCLEKHKTAGIRFRTDEPEHRHLEEPTTTGILHFMNANWFSRRTDTADTATHKSEFIAARTATNRSWSHGPPKDAWVQRP